jgi:hypothetical protein
MIYWNMQELILYSNYPGGKIEKDEKIQNSCSYNCHGLFTDGLCDH